jgi:glutamine phosphoribosylpyrophosphate amidotransferase
MNARPPGLQSSADHRLSGPFAIGARDMDHRGQTAFGMAKRRQQTVHTVKRQINDLGMQAHHPIKHGV